MMVKVRVEDIKSSYYDDLDNTIHLRQDLLSIDKKNEMEGVLEHEITHAFIVNRWGNLFFEYGRLGFMIFLLFAGLYFQYVYMPDSALATCQKELSKLTPIGLNSTGYNPGFFNISKQHPQ
jgi:hypothetical protein